MGSKWIYAFVHCVFSWFASFGTSEQHVGSPSVSLFNLAIDARKTPHVAEVITSCRQQLEATGSCICLIPNFLSDLASEQMSLSLETIYNQSVIDLSNNGKQSLISWVVVQRTIFLSKKMNENFGEDHPFNRLFDNSVGFIDRPTLTENNRDSNIFYQLYTNNDLINFFREIINDESLYLSNDEYGSIYGLVGRDGNVCPWHIDETPFSCVYVIHKPQFGGYLKYVQLAPVMNEQGLFEWDIDLIENVLNCQSKDSIDCNNDMKIVDGNVGDVYCFWGNATLHEVDKIRDESGHPMPRQVKKSFQGSCIQPDQPFSKFTKRKI